MKQVESYIHFHKNHVVTCTRCKSCLVKIILKRLYSEGNIKNTYQCLNCGCMFVCCPRVNNRIKTLNSQITKLRYRLNQMESELNAKSY